MLIVDTFNVLHASAKLGFGRVDVTRLKALIEVSHWAGEHVVLVLDGSPGPRVPGRDSLRRSADVGLDLESRGSGISELYAAGPPTEGGGHVDADAVIESLLEREEVMGRGRLATVVSSDKRVRAAATGARARSLTSEDFLRKLAEDVRKAHVRAAKQDGGRPEFATDDGGDAGRTAYWLREFGLGANGEPTPPPDRSLSSTSGSAPRGKPASRPADQESKASGSEERPQEWGGEIDADDLDMGKILRQHPPKPATNDDDNDSPPRKPKPRR